MGASATSAAGEGRAEQAEALGQDARSGLGRPRCGISYFHSIFHSELVSLTKTRSAYITLSLMFLVLPSTQECFPAPVEKAVGGNAVPEPSDLTCI